MLTRTEKTLPVISNFVIVDGRAGSIISVSVMMKILSSTEPGFEVMDTVCRIS